jgi:3-hydroxyacyl-[acyl-carrier-protein] dehydratase
MQLNIQQIKKIIPHRFPFLLIDRVIDLKPNEKLIAIKNVTCNEHFFEGHFPDEKVMPGVLIIEAMAQAGCIYFYYSRELEGKDLYYYLGKVTAKFMAPVVPGDQLRIEVATVKFLKNTGIVDTKAFVGEQLVTEAQIVFSTRDRT